MNDYPLIPAIEASLGEIASMLGPEWPTFRDRLRALLEQFAIAPDRRAREWMDEVLALGLKSRAKPIFLRLMARVMPSLAAGGPRGTDTPADTTLGEAKLSLETLRQSCAALLRALEHEEVLSVPAVLTQGATPRLARSNEAEPVDCAVFAPASAAPGSNLLMQVFFYSPEQEEQARQQATETDADAQRRGGVSLDLEIPRGTRLWVRLELPGLVLDQAEASLVWRGRPCAAQFAVSVPTEHVPKTVIGKVSVALEGLPVGNLRVKLDVTPGGRGAPAAVSGFAQRFRRAFISYATHDRAEVLKRVQMLRANRIEFFQDFLNIEPGERWEQRMVQELDSCDVFYLFWSSASKNSEWVRREIDYALRRKQGDEKAPPEIIPIPIEGPPIPTPPSELRHIHFNDSLLAHIKVSRQP